MRLVLSRQCSLVIDNEERCLEFIFYGKHSPWNDLQELFITQGWRDGWSRNGAVVRALASHQCDPGLIQGPGVVCWLSLLLVLVLAPRGFSPGTLVFPSPQKPTFLNSNSIWTQWTKSRLVVVPLLILIYLFIYLFI